MRNAMRRYSASFGADSIKKEGQRQQNSGKSVSLASKLASYRVQMNTLPGQAMAIQESWDLK
jgi:hypothetical protein